MNSTKKRPKFYKHLDGDPSSVIKRWIRTASDAMLACDWLIDNTDNSELFSEGVFHGLRDAVERWDNYDSSVFDISINRIGERLRKEVQLIGAQNFAKHHRRIGGILTMYSALQLAARRQSFVNAARQRIGRATFFETDDSTVPQRNDLELIVPIHQIVDVPVLSVVWKYDDEDDPYAEDAIYEIKDLCKQAWSRLPQATKIKLHNLRVRISLVDPPCELKLTDMPINVLDEDGGITINVGLWYEHLNDKEEAIRELAKALKALYFIALGSSMAAEVEN
jgi:hypothetical protein